MNTPSVKTLMQISGVKRDQAILAKWALTHSAEEILESGKFPQTDNYNRSCYHYPGDANILMAACDEALGTYGVEHVAGRNGKSLEYCNAGDPYVATLCFEFGSSIFGNRSLSRVFVGGYGDWVEKYGKRDAA